MSLKGYREKRRQQKKESRAFKKIVQKRTLAAKRKAYAQEAEKVAEEKGRELARRPSFGKRVYKKAKTAYKATYPARRRPVRRTMRRAATTRRQQAPPRSIIEDLF